MAAAQFHIPPPAKFAPKTYDWDQDKVLPVI